MHLSHSFMTPIIQSNLDSDLEVMKFQATSNSSFSSSDIQFEFIRYSNC